MVRPGGPAGAGGIVRKVLSVTALVTPKMRAKTMRRALLMILAMQKMPVETIRELSEIMLAAERARETLLSLRCGDLRGSSQDCLCAYLLNIFIKE